MRRFVECGCCGGYHDTDFVGDCRQDDARFATEEDIQERLGLDGFEVERFEYDEPAWGVAVPKVLGGQPAMLPSKDTPCSRK